MAGVQCKEHILGMSKIESKTKIKTQIEIEIAKNRTKPNQLITNPNKNRTDYMVAVWF